MDLRDEHAFARTRMAADRIRLARRLAGLVIPVVLASCSSGELVIHLGDDVAAEDSQAARPAAAPASPGCGCNALPAADPRVPWSEFWDDIVWSHDARSFALVGRGSLFDVRDEPNEGLRDPPASITGPLRKVMGDLHIFRWGADGAALPTRASDRADMMGYFGSGAWSPDDHYLAVSPVQLRPSGNSLVAIYDVVDGEWISGPPIDWACTTNAAWSPDGHELASVSSQRPANPEHGRQSLVVCDLSGQIQRSALLVDLPRGFDEHALVAWSPDGRWIAALSCITSTRELMLVVFDAASLALIDRAPMLESYGAAPRDLHWRPDSHLLATCVTGKVGLVGIGDDGHISSVRAADSPGEAIDCTWCPDGRSLLVLENRHVKDLQEFLDLLNMRDCKNPDARFDAHALFLDPETGEFSDCPDVVQTRRVQDWRNPWAVPRVAEAFALWPR